MATSIRINHDTTTATLRELSKVRGLHESMEQLIVALALAEKHKYHETHKGLISIGGYIQLPSSEIVKVLTVTSIEYGEPLYILANGMELSRVELYKAKPAPYIPV